MFIIEKNFIFFVSGIALFNFFIAKFVRKRFVLYVGLTINLSILFYYKYLNFFLNDFGFSTIDHLILPAGISFITFHSISYLIDVYDKKIEAEKNFLNFYLFIFMFPQVISGPITRFSKVYKSINLLKSFYSKNGLYLILLGLFQKVIIADYLSLYVNDFHSSENYSLGLNGADSLIVSLIYLLQLYFDFSGYSHIAIGLALLMGIRLPKNFNFPFKAYTISDFWKRWHISLSTFIRDYLFIKINKLFDIKAKENTSRYYFSIIFCMSLSGLWHGANYTFLIWGFLHAIFICIEKYFQIETYKKNIFLKFYFYFALASSFVFFRSSSVDVSVDMLLAVFNNFNILDALFLQYLNLRFIITILISIIIINSNIIKLRFYRRKITNNNFGKFFLLVLICFLFTEIISQNYQPFIYFRF